MKILIYILVLLFLLSCSDFFMKDYLHSLKCYPKELVDHFSLEKGRVKSYSVAVVPDNVGLDDYAFAFNMIELCLVYTAKEYHDVKVKYDSLARLICSVNDTSLILLFSYYNKALVSDSLFTGLESPVKQKLAWNNIHNRKGLPIPLFDTEEYLGKTYSGLHEDFKLYVLEALPGKFMPDKFLADTSECLPERWKHGFSKGVALSDKKKEAVYWIVVW